MSGIYSYRSEKSYFKSDPEVEITEQWPTRVLSDVQFFKICFTDVRSTITTVNSLSAISNGYELTAEKVEARDHFNRQSHNNRPDFMSDV